MSHESAEEEYENFIQEEKDFFSEAPTIANYVVHQQRQQSKFRKLRLFLREKQGQRKRKMEQYVEEIEKKRVLLKKMEEEEANAEEECPGTEGIRRLETKQVETPVQSVRSRN